jgi:hypothetical protein
MRVALALILQAFLSSSYYVCSRFHGTLAFNSANPPHAVNDPETSRDPKALLAEATHLYCNQLRHRQSSLPAVAGAAARRSTGENTQ